MDRSGRPTPGQVNVLLVDDDSNRGRLHRNRLQSLGYHVVQAADADVALTVARQSAPRVIFLSNERSGSGRSPFLQALRSDDHTRHIPVGMLSSGDGSVERLGLRRVDRELW